MPLIRIPKKHWGKVWRVLVASGPIGRSSKEPIYSVSDKQVRLLRRKKLPFEIMDPADGARANGVPARSISPSCSRKKIRSIANEYCLHQYATSYSSAEPRRLCVHGKLVWIVPVVFTSPGIGAVGEVGVLAVDPSTHQVIDATPRSEVKAAGARLAREKRDEIETAFRRARTTR